MKSLPKTLQKLIAAHPDKLEQGHTEQDSWDHEGSWSHWLYLQPGWINTATETHMIHEPTVKEVLEMFKMVQPCECDECQQLKGKR